MADSRSTIPLTTEELNAAASRLLAHADSIVNAARLDVAHDLRLAARAVAALATMRLGVAEVAEKTLDSMARDQLRALLTRTGV